MFTYLEEQHCLSLQRRWWLLQQRRAPAKEVGKGEHRIEAAGTPFHLCLCVCVKVC